MSPRHTSRSQIIWHTACHVTLQHISWKRPAATWLQDAFWLVQSECRKNNSWEFMVPYHELILVAQYSSARETLMHSSQRWLDLCKYTIVEPHLLNVMHPKLTCSALPTQSILSGSFTYTLTPSGIMRTRSLFTHISNCHWGSLVLPLYTLLHQPAMDISLSKSNIRGLIRLKTMSHKSANDRIIRLHNHTTRMMQNANQLSGTIWSVTVLNVVGVFQVLQLCVYFHTLATL